SDSRLAGCAPSEARINRRRATSRARYTPGRFERGRRDAAGLGPVAGVGRLCRAAVRGGVDRRPLSALSAATLAATAGLQPGAGGLLLVLDLLRRGRHRGALGHRLPADLPGSDAAAPVRL